MALFDYWFSDDSHCNRKTETENYEKLTEKLRANTDCPKRQLNSESKNWIMMRSNSEGTGNNWWVQNEIQ